MLAKKREKWALAASADSLIKLLSPLIMSGQHQTPSGVSKDCRSALFLCLDNLGDTVMATPAIDAYKTRFPRSRLVVMTRPPNEAVFANNPNIDRLVLDDAPWWSSRPLLNSLRPSYWLAWRSKIKEFRKEAFDVVVDLRGDLRHILLFGVPIMPRILLGYSRTGGGALLSANVPYNADEHEIDKKLKLLRPLGISGLRPAARIWLTEEELCDAERIVAERLGNLEHPIVLIDPGAKPVQQWPIERFAEVIRTLSTRLSKPVLISSGSAYSGLAQRLANIVGKDCCRLLGPIDLRTFFSIVSVIDLVISADTGISHIASAVGTNTLTIFGPTDPGRFWQGSKRSVIVKSEGSPCTTTLHEVCGKSGPNKPGACMLEISTEMVLDAVRSVLGVER